MTKSLINSTMPCDSSMMAAFIENLQNDFPLITVKTIGKSVLEKPIQELRIGKGTKKVHMNASFHANEWITTIVLLNFVHHYLLSLSNESTMRGHKVQDIYESVDLSIVPMVNPDGVDLVLNGPPPRLRDELVKINNGCDEFVHWKANINGVDLNKQFPANWELLTCNEKHPTIPSPRDYPGAKPLSEPEAITMAELARANQFDRLIAFHTQGKEFYWGYEGFEPSESEDLAIVFEQVSGYKAIRYVDSHAGYKDWFIQEFRRSGFTLELGWGINPLPLSQFPEIQKNVEGIFLAALIL